MQVQCRRVFFPIYRGKAPEGDGMEAVCAGSTIGAYRVEEFIGRGGFACLYRAKARNGENVALKIGSASGGGRYITRFNEVTDERRPDGVSPDEAPAEVVVFGNGAARLEFLDVHEVGALFQREYELLARICHRNVVNAREIFTHEDRTVLVMDYVPGKTLREKIRNCEGIRLNWFLTIVRALVELKRSGKLAYHGDVKPENIIVKPSGSVVLIDPAARDAEQSMITTSPHYNPLFLCSSKADVMGIGVMLYEILTGVMPFDEVPWEFAGRESHGEEEQFSLSYFLSYPPAKRLKPNTPEALERIVSHCLTAADYDLPELEADIVAFLRME